MTTELLKFDEKQASDNISLLIKKMNKGRKSYVRVSQKEKNKMIKNEIIGNLEERGIFQ